jgi:hypothetical protein
MSLPLIQDTQYNIQYKANYMKKKMSDTPSMYVFMSNVL